ncbi:hypothetical protein [Mesorhizobium sp.]|uniref:hypothetical protein n=1 Tax=Mesorhizobium sp. TaxID=1871066 RepID=UPI003426228B
MQPPAASAERLAKVVELLGLAWDDEGLADLCVAIDNQVDAVRPAPFAADRDRHPRRRHAPRCRAVRLVAGRPGAGARPAPAAAAATADGAGRPGEKGFERAVCVALVQVTAEACRLHPSCRAVQKSSSPLRQSCAPRAPAT